jgi:DMSO/TMAO reductase YedYZ molybdopterin-dependent catalytic subunit
LSALETHLPIACVEGWSIGAQWRGPRLLDLVKRAGGDENSLVTVVSLQPDGAYRDSRIVSPQLQKAVLATHINGKRLSLDHGYPLRLIAPDRAGVLQTKWINRIEVS